MGGAPGHPVTIEPLEGRRLLSTYYVSPAGSDSAAGTSAAPWRTLQRAADAAAAGDTVHVRAGTYGEGMNFFGRAGGTRGAPITFVADAGVTITHAATEGVNADVAAINVESSGGWYVFEGCAIRGDGSMSKAGIRVADTGHVRLIDNVVDGAFTGIFVSYSKGSWLEGNVCRNSTGQHGIYVSAGTRWTVVRGNRLYGNNWDGLHMNALNGAPDAGAVVEDNVIDGNTLSGMDLQGITGAYIRNNVIYANAKHGITVHSQDQADTPFASDNTFVGNTVAGNGMFAIQFRPGDTRGTVLFDNVLLSSSPGFGAIGVDGTVRGLTSDYNVVDAFSMTLGAQTMSWRRWRRVTGRDGHSRVASADQLFVNAGVGDYRLRAGAVAIDAGARRVDRRYAPDADQAGGARPRGRGYDVGAYEFKATA
jgi:parallel beta-helix repeat protein